MTPQSLPPPPPTARPPPSPFSPPTHGLLSNNFPTKQLALLTKEEVATMFSRLGYGIIETILCFFNVCMIDFMLNDNFPGDIIAGYEVLEDFSHISGISELLKRSLLAEIHELKTNHVPSYLITPDLPSKRYPVFCELFL